MKRSLLMTRDPVYGDGDVLTSMVKPSLGQNSQELIKILSACLDDSRMTFAAEGSQ